MSPNTSFPKIPDDEQESLCHTSPISIILTFRRCIDFLIMCFMCLSKKITLSGIDIRCCNLLKRDFREALSAEILFFVPKAPKLAHSNFIGLQNFLSKRNLKKTFFFIFFSTKNFFREFFPLRSLPNPYLRSRGLLK